MAQHGIVFRLDLVEVAPAGATATSEVPSRWPSFEFRLKVKCIIVKRAVDCHFTTIIIDLNIEWVKGTASGQTPRS